MHELQVTGRSKKPFSQYAFDYEPSLQVSLVFGVVQVAEQKTATDFRISSKGRKYSKNQSKI